MIKNLLHYKHRRLLLSSSLWKQRFLFWGGAIVVGVVAAFFADLCEIAQQLFEHIVAYSSFLPLVITPCGFMIASFVARRYFPGSQGSGIPNVIAARKLKDPVLRKRLLSTRILVGKILLTVFALAIGASIGREGPTVQIGAAIMLAAGTFFGRNKQHGLILAGGAAGVAAAFNTPLAGIVFAIEELGRRFERRSSNFVLTAIILAGVSSMAITGNYTYFGSTTATLSFKGWHAVIACAVVGGVMGGLFSRFVIAALHYKLPYKISDTMRAFPIRTAGICGLSVAVLGLLSHNSIYGTGYQEARLLIEAATPAPWYYGITKMAATVFSSISGIPGGLFAPSLSAGAGFGANVAYFMPEVSASAVVILGMVAYFSGIVQAPITAFVIVFEMTNNHTMVVPIMAASILATAISRSICRKSIYHVLAEKMLAGLHKEDDIPSLKEKEAG